MTTGIRLCGFVLAVGGYGCRCGAPEVTSSADGSFTANDVAEVDVYYRNANRTIQLYASVDGAILNDDRLDWSDIAFGISTIRTGTSEKFRIGSLSSPDPQGMTHIGIQLRLEQCPAVYPFAVFARISAPKRLLVVARDCVIEEIRYEPRR